MHKITYWGNFARVKAITICFDVAKIPYNMEVISGSDFSAAKHNEERFPTGQIPVLTLPDGQVVAQSTAIARYAAKMANLYPVDPVEALIVDEIIDTCNEVVSKVPFKNGNSPDKKRLREEWAQGQLQTQLKYFNRRVSAAGKIPTFVVNGKFTVADVYLYITLRNLNNGIYEHVSPDIVKPHTALGPYFEFLKNDPVFKQFAY